MRRLAVIIAVLRASVRRCAPAAQNAPAVQHVPLHEAFTGAAELRFRVREPDRAGSIVMHCKPRAAGATRALGHRAARRTFYVARVPVACAKPPGFHVLGGAGRRRRRAPAVRERGRAARGARHDTPEREGEQRRLRAGGYKRSRVMVAAEGVDFGDHRPAPGADVVHDRYYRVEAGYGYAFFERIEDIALTLVRVRGESGLPDSASSRPESPRSTPASTSAVPGDPAGQRLRAHARLAVARRIAERASSTARAASSCSAIRSPSTC